MIRYHTICSQIWPERRNWIAFGQRDWIYIYIPYLIIWSKELQMWNVIPTYAAWKGAEETEQQQMQPARVHLQKSNWRHHCKFQQPNKLPSTNYLNWQFIQQIIFKCYLAVQLWTNWQTNLIFLAQTNDYYLQYYTSTI